MSIGRSAAAVAPVGSLWEATAVSGPITAPLAGNTSVEVCIVGAGFTGLSAALHLAELGVSAVVLESGGPGFGASGRNGGQVLPGLKWDPDELVARYGAERGERLVSFVGAAPDLVYDVIETHGINCALRRNCGWLNAAIDDAAFAAQAKRVAQWQARGADVELVDRQEASRLLGTLRYRGALLDRRAGALNPLGYARGLAAAAQRKGAIIHSGSKVRRLAREDGRWHVECEGGLVRSESVLLCTNGYTDRLWPGLAQEVIPIHSLQVATRPLSDNQRRGILPEGHVVSDTQRILLYFRLDDEGRLIMGGRGSLGEKNCHTLYRFVEGAAQRLFPQIGVPEWQFRWAGKVALTTDHMPRVHELAPGLRTCLGYNGRGVAMATAMGKALADWTCTGDVNEVPLPPTPLQPIPLHGFRRPVLELISAYYRLRDRFA